VDPSSYTQGDKQERHIVSYWMPPLHLFEVQVLHPLSSYSFADGFEKKKIVSGRFFSTKFARA